jgi:hypothetical protein
VQRGIRGQTLFSRRYSAGRKKDFLQNYCGEGEGEGEGEGRGMWSVRRAGAERDALPAPVSFLVSSRVFQRPTDMR